MECEVRHGTIEQVVEIMRDIPEFEEPYEGYEIKNRIENTDHVVLTAILDERIIGFKVGYDRFKNGRGFYSWLGGVLTDQRGKGVAQRLQDEMEDFCIRMGYSELWMKTRNYHRNMLHFAIKNSFQIMQVKEMENALENRIWLCKSL